MFKEAVVVFKTITVFIGRILMGRIGFYLGNYYIAYYGLMIVVGILVSFLVAFFQIKRYHLVLNDFVIICSVCGLSGIVGAKVLYLLVSFDSIDVSRLFDIVYLGTIMRGGFVFLGGVIGAFPALLFCKKKLNIPVATYIQPCIGCLPIAHAFGRVGCCLVGCCYGVPYDGPFSVTYIESFFAPNHIPLFPVQMAEVILELSIGIGLIVFSSKLKGTMGLWVYLILYSCIRFLLEFVRYDEARGSLAGMSTSQILSIALCIISLCCYKREKVSGKYMI